MIADLQYLQAFLLTYRAFMTPDELFSLISKAWEGLEAIDATRALPVRLRIVNSIKYWMEKFWFDFSEDRNLLNKLQVLVNNTMSTQAKLQKQLTRVLERKVDIQHPFFIPPFPSPFHLWLISNAAFRPGC